jgi:hypothetical protein
MQIKLRVLFIGDSYTYFNNVPHLLHMLVESAREERGIETRMVVEPGFTLKRHWDDPGAVSAIHAERWDHVILQEQSTLGGSTVIDDIPQINAPTMFHEYARLFDHEIRKAGAKTVFFLTWARKDSPGSQPLLNTAYLRIAKELRARLAPVGMAWERHSKQTDPSASISRTSHTLLQRVPTWLLASYMPLYLKAVLRG